MVDCHLGRQRRVNHAYTRQKKIKMLAVKIDQPKTRSIYFFDLAFGVIWNDRFLGRFQFRIERRDDTDPLHLGSEPVLAPKRTAH